MYEIIAQEYEQLFPLDTKRLTLLKHVTRRDTEQSILDIGSATGEFVRAVASLHHRAVGYEPEKSLLVEANRLVQNHSYTYAPQFVQAGMLDVQEKECFDQIYCMGNTLVHLSDEPSVKEFFHRAFQALRPNGCFILQVINFSRFAEYSSYDFPLIETPFIRFARSYHTITSDKITFTIRILHKERDVEESASTILFPIKPNVLSNLLTDAQFHAVSFYSHYDLLPFTGKEDHFIVIAQKT